MPSTGITNYGQVARKYAELAASHGAELKTGAGVVGFRNSGSETVVQTRAGDFTARYVVNCAGLYSDRIAHLAGHDPEIMIVPFRGEYYDPDSLSIIARAQSDLSRSRSALPFSGCAFHAGELRGRSTRDPMRFSPCAAKDINAATFISARQWPHSPTVAFAKWRAGCGATVLRNTGGRCRKALSYARSQQMLPEVRAEDLVPGGAGVRAQALAPDGKLVDDFRFVPREGFLHVLNVPSPAATASLPIGREILKIVPTQFLKHSSPLA